MLDAFVWFLLQQDQQKLQLQSRYTSESERTENKAAVGPWKNPLSLSK